MQRLAVPPQTSDAVTSSGPLIAQDAPPTEPLHSAIALQPPNQSNTPHRPDTLPHSACPSPTAAGLSQGHAEEEAAPVTTEVALYYNMMRFNCFTVNLPVICMQFERTCKLCYLSEVLGAVRYNTIEPVIQHCLSVFHSSLHFLF